MPCVVTAVDCLMRSHPYLKLCYLLPLLKKSHPYLKSPCCVRMSVSGNLGWGYDDVRFKMVEEIN